MSEDAILEVDLPAPVIPTHTPQMEDKLPDGVFWIPDPQSRLPEKPLYFGEFVVQ